MAFWGIPDPSVEICIGALPAATLRTVNIEKIGEDCVKDWSNDVYEDAIMMMIR